MKNVLLGELTARQFLKTCWQKKPFLVRQGIPDFADLLSPGELFSLSQRNDVESRLIIRHARNWELRHGPFEKGVFRKLPKTRWTLLVQGINHVLPAAAALLARFSFIPHARLDDLMVSFAAPGGGVGPHVDFYDVFLLQGMGKRRWQISAQKDQQQLANTSLKILRRFRAQREWILASGDMLYLPPRHAHHGIALDECMTYSVGFRAPGAQEVLNGFLSYLQDKSTRTDYYEDPRLTPARCPGTLVPAMVDWVHRVLGQLRWGRRDIETWLGQYLTEPKPHVFFSPPRPPLAFSSFRLKVNQQGPCLALTSQMLYTDHVLFMNGESVKVTAQTFRALRPMANRRQLESRQDLDDKTMRLLYDWYRAGYLDFPPPIPE